MNLLQPPDYPKAPVIGNKTSMQLSSDDFQNFIKSMDSREALLTENPRNAITRFEDVALQWKHYVHHVDQITFRYIPGPTRYEYGKCVGVHHMIMGHYLDYFIATTKAIKSGTPLSLNQQAYLGMELSDFIDFITKNRIMALPSPVQCRKFVVLLKIIYRNLVQTKELTSKLRLPTHWFGEAL